MQPLCFDATEDSREEVASSCSEWTGPLPAWGYSQSYEGEPGDEDSDGMANSDPPSPPNSPDPLALLTRALKWTVTCMRSVNMWLRNWPYPGQRRKGH
ncbi:hypothetical protein SRHO_G00216460 [Serrasalmus rhombeus]